MTNWPTKKLGEVLEYEQPTKYLVSSTDYKDEYLTPVLTAGKSFILGNTKEKDGVFPKEKLPVIIFDDFTTAIKFVDFPFKVKSSAMKILHAKKNETDIRFMFYKMLTIKFPHNQHKRYWISECSKIEIPLPPLTTQKQIVERLDKIAEAQKLNDDLIQKTDELFQSLLHQELNPAGPADAKAIAGNKDWEVKKLGEVANFINGRAFKPKDWGKKGLPIIRIQNLNNKDANFNYYEGETDDRYLVRKGDLLFSWSGNIGTSFGAFIWNREDAILNQHIFKIRIKITNLNKDYFFFYINKIITEIESKTHGITGLVHITKGTLEKIKILIPSEKTQKQIVAKLSAVQNYKNELLQQKMKLKELFDSALYKSFQHS